MDFLQSRSVTHTPGPRAPQPRLPANRGQVSAIQRAANTRVIIAAVTLPLSLYPGRRWCCLPLIWPSWISMSTWATWWAIQCKGLSVVLYQACLKQYLSLFYEFVMIIGVNREVQWVMDIVKLIHWSPRVYFE